MPSLPPLGLCRFVTAFREWLDANGGSVGWAPGVSPELPPRETRREVLLDRYESHTKHCPSCMKVLQQAMAHSELAQGLFCTLCGPSLNLDTDPSPVNKPRAQSHNAMLL